LNRTGYGSMGGHLSRHHKVYATKHDVSEAIHEHEGALHSKDPKTRIKLAAGGLAHGGPAKMRGDKKSRGHTTVNVVMANHPHPKPVPVPVSVPAGGPPGGMPPGMAGAGPPMPPPGAGGPPGMPPMNRGGHAYKKGGAVKADSQRDEVKGMPEGKLKKGGKAYPVDDGAGGGEGRLEKAASYGAKVKKK